MKKIIFLFSFLFSTLYCFSQKQDRVWVFGDSTGIDFNNLSNPNVIQSICNNNEINAAISDSLGNLLLYFSDYPGSSNIYGAIRDEQNQIIENGDSIKGLYTASNGALFLFIPDTSKKQYLFTIGRKVSVPYLTLFFSEVISNDTSQIVITKNNALVDSISEHLISVRHGNGRDWWVIARKRNTDSLAEFLITPNGITGPFYREFGSHFYLQGMAGESAISKNGDKIAFLGYYGNADVYDFDRCTGEFSNFIEFGTQPYNAVHADHQLNYSCSFSPDGNRFYLGTIEDWGDSIFTNIYQYTLNAPNPIQTRDTILFHKKDFALGQMELAPDDKIYIAGFKPGSGYLLDSSYKYLSVINSPNDSGAACDLQLFSFYLQGKTVNGGLPNMPNYNLGRLVDSPCDTLTDGIADLISETENIFSVYPNPNEGEFIVSSSALAEKIIVTDVLGRRILSVTNPELKLKLNLGNAPPGMYYITAIGKNIESKTEKIIVIK